MIALADLQALVGPPPLVTERYQRTHGGLVEWGWRDAIAGLDGWWWAVTIGDAVIAIGWTAGGTRDRNDEIRRAVNKHMRPEGAAGRYA